MPKTKILYAVLSGLLLTVSFPPTKLDWAIWIALVPLLKSLADQAPSKAFFLGFAAGLTHYLTLVYWVVVAMHNYGGLSYPISVSALFLLSLYLSLYLGIFSYLASLMRGSSYRLLMMPSLWVGLEFIRGKALTGFPWCLLGYSQFKHLYLIQVADLVGVYGISFLIILTNAVIYCLFFDRHSQRGGALKWGIPILLLLGISTLGYAYHRLEANRTGGGVEKSVRVAIVQGNIDQSIKWNPAYQKRTVETYQRLTQSTADFAPGLVVWPETAVPFFFQDNRELAPAVFKISEEAKSHLIFGSPAYKRKPGGITYYNRVYLLSPQGKLSGYYDKVHLVPFGEYVPLKRFFPFFNRLVQAAGDFASGEKLEPLKLSHFSAGILICFEVIFPELARIQAREGANILVNLTNDAWFGMTSAPYQHLSMAVFRAVENGRPMIRAANTGISAFIGPRGQIINRGGLFIEDVLKREVGLAYSSSSFYTRYGDLFAIALLAISLIKTFHMLCYNKLFFDLFKRS